MPGLEGIRWNAEGLQETLKAFNGPTGRYLLKQGVKVRNIAVRKISGPYHGAWSGHPTNPSAPGNPPGFRTGRLRGSVTIRPAKAMNGEIEVAIGTNVPYGMYLELARDANRKYPWLKPSFEDEGYVVHMLV